MKSYWAQFYCWLSNTPNRSLERAYEASKRIRYIKKDYMSYKDMVSYPRRFWQAMLLYMNTKLNNYIFIIYWSLSECKISLYLLNLPNNLLFIITKTFPFLFSKKSQSYWWIYIFRSFEATVSHFSTISSSRGLE